MIDWKSHIFTDSGQPSITPVLGVSQGFGWLWGYITVVPFFFNSLSIYFALRLLSDVVLDQVSRSSLQALFTPNGKWWVNLTEDSPTSSIAQDLVILKRVIGKRCPSVCAKPEMPNGASSPKRPRSGWLALSWLAGRYIYIGQSVFDSAAKQDAYISVLRIICM